MAETLRFNQFDATESRKLNCVRMFSDPDLVNWPGVVELLFDEFTVFVCVETEDDTLLCTRQLPDSFARIYTVEIPATFWDPVMGWTLTEAWQMTNDRGYVDAIQFRFREEPNSGEYRRLQVMAICSSIQLEELQSIREEPNAGTAAS